MQLGDWLGQPEYIFDASEQLVNQERARRQIDAGGAVDTTLDPV